jgi:hypothetical protein
VGPGHDTLTASDVHQLTQAHCRRYLRLQDHGPQGTAPVLVAVLLWAASRPSSLAAALWTWRPLRPRTASD